MFSDWYWDYYHVAYVAAPYESEFFLKLYGSGITLTFIGVGIDIAILRREKREQGLAAKEREQGVPLR